MRNQHVANRLMFGFIHHKPVIMSLTVQKWWLANFIWSVVLAASGQYSTVAAVTPRCFATHLNPLYYSCYVMSWLLISALFLKGVLLLLSLYFGLQGMKLDRCGSLWTVKPNMYNCHMVNFHVISLTAQTQNLAIEHLLLHIVTWHSGGTACWDL